MEQATPPTPDFAASPCPHLAAAIDQATYYAFPATGNICLGCRPPARPALDHQDQFCLSGAHGDCPIYLAPSPGPMPANIALHRGPLAVLLQSPRRLVPLLVATVIIAVIAIQVVRGDRARDEPPASSVGSSGPVAGMVQSATPTMPPSATPRPPTGTPPPASSVSASPMPATWTTVPLPSATTVPDATPFTAPGGQGEATATSSARPTTSPTAPAPASPTVSPSATVALGPTPAAQAQIVVASINQRLGPGTDYPVLRVLTRQNLLTVIARNQSGSWYYVQTATGQPGWVAAALLEPVRPFDPEALPVRVAPPPPLPSPTPSPISPPAPPPNPPPTAPPAPPPAPTPTPSLPTPTPLPPP